jgi:hypothetical protein
MVVALLAWVEWIINPFAKDYIAGYEEAGKEVCLLLLSNKIKSPVRIIPRRDFFIYKAQ